MATAEQRAAALDNLVAAARRNWRSDHPDHDLHAALVAYQETPKEEQ